MTNQHRSSTWPADRVAEARAVIADVAHHSDLLVRLSPLAATTVDDSLNLYSDIKAI